MSAATDLHAPAAPQSPAPRPLPERSPQTPGSSPASARRTGSAAAHGRSRRRIRGPFRSGEFWRTLLTHLITPLFLGTGMALAYLGAFHAPSPHHLPVAVVGQGEQTAAFAQSLNDAADGDLQVRTVGTADQAQQLVRDRDVVAAYAPGEDQAALYVATAASASDKEVAQQVLGPIAFRQHLPLQTVDVVPTSGQDTSGQSIFFMLVALSVGGYSSAVAIAAATAKVSYLGRLLISVAVSFVIAALVTIVVADIMQAIPGHRWGVLMLSWLYVSTISLLGVALHPILHRWTTPFLVMCFVMLNFTSSTGIFSAHTAPAFFQGLSTFWNGAAWLRAVQTLVYFPGQPFWWDILRLGLWFVVVGGLMGLTHWFSIHRTRVVDEEIPVDEDEEGIAA